MPINTRRNPMKRALAVSFCLAWAAAGMSVPAAAGLVAEWAEIAPALKGRVPRSPRLFQDRKGALNAVFILSGQGRSGDLCQAVYDNGRWSSPVVIGEPSPNDRALHVVQTFSNGTPMMLLQGDETDYGRLFGLTAPPAVPDDENAPFLAGMTFEEFGRLLFQNQRLQYRFQTAEGWSDPALLPGTFAPADPVLATGSDGTALAVFLKDEDGNPGTATLHVFYSIYKDRHWGDPARLTVSPGFLFGLEAVRLGEEYLVVWTEDRDADGKTSHDRMLRYRTLTPSGQILHAPSDVIPQPLDKPSYTLGLAPEGAVLLWSSSTPVSESRYNGRWSDPRPTGLASATGPDRLFQRKEGLLRVYEDRGVLMGALRMEDRWSAPVRLHDFNDPAFRVSEYDLFLDEAGELWLAAAARRPAAVETLADDPGEGLYAAHVSLGPDLRVRDVADVPFSKELGRKAEVNFTIENAGAFPSEPYEARIESGGSVLWSVRSPGLPPGTTQSFRHEIVLDKAETLLDISVDGRARRHAIRIRPDFWIREIKRLDASHWEINVEERKGIAASPALVHVSLIQGGARRSLDVLEFDPNRAEPLVLESTSAASLAGPFQLLAEVNPDRSIEEDDHTNNKDAYNFSPLSDLVIAELAVDQDQIRVRVEDRGERKSPSAALLLTDDPDFATRSFSPDGAPPHLLETVSLPSSGGATLSRSRSSVPFLKGPRLYAVVNPDRAVPESNHGNNLSMMLVPPSGTVFPKMDGPSALELKVVRAWCGRLHLQARNKGLTAAVGTVVQVLDPQGAVAAQALLPYLGGHENESLFLKDLAPGVYTLRIVGNPDGDGPTLEMPPAADCPALAGRDLVLDGLRAKRRGRVLFIAFETVLEGFGLNGRRPLLPVPFTVEVKRGTKTIHKEQRRLFVPAGKSRHRLHLRAKSLDHGGDLQLIVRLQERDDEDVHANNFQSITVPGRRRPWTAK